MNGYGFCALFAIIMAFTANSHGLEFLAYLLLGATIVCIFKAID